ncbi:MAG TPA: hypothetical protein VK636_10530 [Gemmatimonadaceae bacterium]|nr:hypothetical protein [Gemmatimonadaceae bacterium]
MAQFIVGQDISTPESSIAVDLSIDKPLPKGQHTFQLVVEDDDGLLSDPFTIDIIVRDDNKPTAVMSAPQSVQFGQSFKLDGSKSSDVAPGKVVKYIWTLLK